jgi:hypothetical protein
MIGAGFQRVEADYWPPSRRAEGNQRARLASPR